MMEALSCSETSVLTRATWYNIPEDGILPVIYYMGQGKPCQKKFLTYARNIIKVIQLLSVISECACWKWGHAIAQVVSHWISTVTDQVREHVRLCGFVVDKAALGQVSSEYFSFPCHSFHRLLHSHHNPFFAACTMDLVVADIPSGHSLIPPLEARN
jgi:hypothetical protein